MTITGRSATPQVKGRDTVWKPYRAVAKLPCTWWSRDRNRL